MKLYDNLYRPYCPFSGKVVAEIGAGPYALRYYLRQQPARYLAVNLGFSEEYPTELPLELIRSTADSIPIDDESVDVVISENCFEHLVNYRAMIGEMHRILKPGGMLATQFSPLFYSPYGAHFHDTSMLPWIHFFFDEETLRDLIEELSPSSETFDYNWEQYRSLNRLRPSDFVRPFQDGSWDIRRLEAFPFRWSLRASDPIRSLLTHGLRVVAARR